MKNRGLICSHLRMRRRTRARGGLRWIGGDEKLERRGSYQPRMYYLQFQGPNTNAVAKAAGGGAKNAGKASFKEDVSRIKGDPHTGNSERDELSFVFAVADRNEIVRDELRCRRRWIR